MLELIKSWQRSDQSWECVRVFSMCMCKKVCSSRWEICWCQPSGFFSSLEGINGSLFSPFPGAAVTWAVVSAASERFSELLRPEPLRTCVWCVVCVYGFVLLSLSRTVVFQRFWLQGPSLSKTKFKIPPWRFLRIYFCYSDCFLFYIMLLLMAFPLVCDL